MTTEQQDWLDDHAPRGIPIAPTWTTETTELEAITIGRDWAGIITAIATTAIAVILMVKL